MKGYITKLIEENDNVLIQKSLIREYLQSRILQLLQDLGAFQAWVFHGGTALRFLYSIARYSEDLDFSLVKKEKRPFEETIEKIQSKLSLENYRVSTKLNEKLIVKSASIEFKGLLHEFHLSPHQNEKLSIKIELDIHPPLGGSIQTTLIRRHVILNLFHYDHATLLAGKINAFLTRKFVKGRDVYDLMWFLSNPNSPLPNFAYLNNALKQFGWNGVVSEKNWQSVIEEKLKTINWEGVIKDVTPFIERTEELHLLTKDSFMQLMEQRRVHAI